MVGLKQPRRQRSLTLPPTSDMHRCGRKRDRAPYRRTKPHLREETSHQQEELGPAGNLLVMEEGFAKVIFQQIFIERPHLPGPGIHTVPVLMDLDPSRGPVERVGVGNGAGATGEGSFLFLGRGPGT